MDGVEVGLGLMLVAIEWWGSQTLHSFCHFYTSSVFATAILIIKIVSE